MASTPCALSWLVHSLYLSWLALPVLCHGWCTPHALTWLALPLLFKGCILCGKELELPVGVVTSGTVMSG